MSSFQQSAPNTEAINDTIQCLEFYRRAEDSILEILDVVQHKPEIVGAEVGGDILEAVAERLKEVAEGTANLQDPVEAEREKRRELEAENERLRKALQEIANSKADPKYPSKHILEWRRIANRALDGGGGSS